MAEVIQIQEKVFQEKQNAEQQKQNLSLEQQKVYDRINELENLLDINNSVIIFTKKSAKSLGIRLQADPSIKDDPEAWPTIKLYQTYIKRFNDAVQKWSEIKEELNKLETELAITIDNVEYEKWVDEQTNKLKYNNENLKTISNRDFLSLSVEKRLQYITKNNIDSDNISSWVVKELTFSFDQDWDWRINQDLYLLTTAWQVLPKEVRDVLKDWIEYTRVWLTWEFYFWDKRLTIHDKTEITIGKIASEDELGMFSEENQNKYNEFLENNPEYKDEKFQNIINEALEKWIEVKKFIQVVSRRIEEFEKQNSFEQAEIEEIATEYAKIPWYQNNDIGAIVKVFKYMTPATWKSNMIECWYNHREVDKYSPNNYESWELLNFIPAEYSYPIERSSSWTTLCSRTARLNLSKLGISNPSTWWSAREAWQNLWSPTDNFPPKDENVKVADIYLDAKSSKNKQYGHRVAAFKKEWQWFVLDPYYKIFWNTRKPILAEEYIKKVWDKQKVWWVKYYT